MKLNLRYEDKPWLKVYDEGVPESIEFETTLLHEFLERHCQNIPDNTAFIFQGYRISFRQFNDIAQGAAPLFPPIDGTDDTSVRTSWEVLGSNPCLGKRVAIIGCGAVGLETALLAAKKGTLSPEMLHSLMTYEALEMERIRHYMFNGASKVTVFEMLEKAGQDVGKFTKWILMNNLDRYGVKINASSKVVSIKEGLVTYEREGELFQEQFDTVVLASGSRPVQTLEGQVKELDIPYSVIGDCVKPGNINDAVHGGFLAAISL